MKVSGWTAWYTQGRVFNSRDTSWPELPVTGVLVLMVFVEDLAPSGHHRRKVFHGQDNYVRYGTGSFLADFENTNEERSGSEVKQGAMVSDSEIEATVQLARASRWPPGS